MVRTRLIKECVAEHAGEGSRVRPVFQLVNRLHHCGYNGLTRASILLGSTTREFPSRWQIGESRPWLDRVHDDRRVVVRKATAETLEHDSILFLRKNVRRAAKRKRGIRQGLVSNLFARQQHVHGQVHELQVCRIVICVETDCGGSLTCAVFLEALIPDGLGTAWKRPVTWKECARHAGFRECLGDGVVHLAPLCVAPIQLSHREPLAVFSRRRMQMPDMAGSRSPPTSRRMATRIMPRHRNLCNKSIAPSKACVTPFGRLRSESSNGVGAKTGRSSNRCVAVKRR